MKRILVIEDDEMLNAGLCYANRLGSPSAFWQKNYGKKNHLT